MLQTPCVSVAVQSPFSFDTKNRSVVTDSSAKKQKIILSRVSRGLLSIISPSLSSPSLSVISSCELIRIISSGLSIFQPSSAPMSSPDILKPNTIVEILPLKYGVFFVRTCPKPWKFSPPTAATNIDIWGIENVWRMCDSVFSFRRFLFVDLKNWCVFEIQSLTNSFGARNTDFFFACGGLKRLKIYAKIAPEWLGGGGV